MHPVKHMHLTGLVLVLKMAVIKVLLEVEHDLTLIRSIHHEDSGGHTAIGQRVLALQLDIAILSGCLRASQERCPFLVGHRPGATAYHLHIGGETGWFAVTELPVE